MDCTVLVLWSHGLYGPCPVAQQTRKPAELRSVTLAAKSVTQVLLASALTCGFVFWP